MIGLGVAAGLALGACTDHEAARLTKVKDAVCACKTSRCAEKAMEGIPKGKVESNHRTQVIARSMLDCLAKLYDAEQEAPDEAPASPAPDPAPPPAAARTP